MYCPNCNKEARPNANFCRYCGQKLPLPEKPEAAAPAAVPAPKQKSRKKNLLLPIGISAAVLALAAAAFVLVLPKHRQAQPVQSTPVMSAADTTPEELPEESNPANDVPEERPSASTPEETPAMQTPEEEQPSTEEELPAVEEESERVPAEKFLFADETGFFSKEDTDQIVAGNQQLLNAHQISFAWQLVEELNDQTIDEASAEAFDSTGMQESDFLCLAVPFASVPSVWEWYVCCGSEVKLDTVLEQLITANLDAIFANYPDRDKRILSFYQALDAWFSLAEAETPEGLLPDGYYIMRIGKENLTVADEGIYATADIYQQITLPQEALAGIAVGDTVDLSTFGKGVFVVDAISDSYISVAPFDEASQSNLGYLFVYRDNCWEATMIYDDLPGYYTSGTGKVLFTEQSQTIDYLTYINSGDNIYGQSYSDVREFFTAGGYEHFAENMRLFVRNGVVVEALIYYHP